MPIHHKRGILYSSLELSQIINVPQEKIDKFIGEEHFTRATKIDNLSYIEKNNLALFFDEFLSYLHIVPTYYKIPEDLKNSTTPWATTLVKMYQGKLAHDTSLSPSQGQLLKDLVCNLHPKNVLEIGCFIGISTIWMAAGLEQAGNEATIHSIDLFYEIMPCLPKLRGYLSNPLEFAQKSASSAQLSHRITFYKMHSYEMWKNFNRVINKPIDFLFIDGDHSIRGCMNDFALFYPHVSTGGYIVLHDIYPEYCGYKGPRYLIDRFVKKSSCFDVVEIKTRPYNFGMAIIQKIRENKRFYPGVNLRLDIIRARANLQKTTVWQKIKDTPIGTIVRKIFK